MSIAQSRPAGAVSGLVTWWVELFRGVATGPEPAGRPSALAPVLLLLGDVRLALIAAVVLLSSQGDAAALASAAALVSLPLAWLLRRQRSWIDGSPVVSWGLLAADLFAAMLVLAAAGADGLALAYFAVTAAVAGLRLGNAGATAAFAGIGAVHVGVLIFAGTGLDLVILVAVRLGLIAVAGYATARLRVLLLTRESLVAEVGRLESSAVRDQERRRLARDMHDSLAKTLHGSVLLGRRVEQRLRREGHRDAEEAAIVVAALLQAQEEARRLLTSLRDDVHGSLSYRLGRLADRWQAHSGLPLQRYLPDVGLELSVDACDELVRACAELLENVHRHAGAGSARVTLSQDGDLVQVEITDDGRGLPAPDLVELGRHGHYGLVGVQERMVRVGGRMQVLEPEGARRGAPGRGARIRLSVPLTRTVDLTAAESARGVVGVSAPGWSRT